MGRVRHSQLEGNHLHVASRFDVTAPSFGASVAKDNNVAAIQAAIDAAHAAGGGVVVLPHGTFTIGQGATAGVGLSFADRRNVTLRGAGVGATILRLAPGANAHMINLSGAENISIRDLTLDGNRGHQTAAVHGVRSSGVDGLTITDAELRDIAGYGIGLQTGAQARVYLARLYIRNTGSDGIDLKNPTNNNRHLLFTDIVVENHGLNESLTVQAGIDIRGPAQLKGICVRGLVRDLVGVRFRDSGGGSVGDGGHRSSLTGFEIRATEPGTAAMGVVSVATDVTIQGGTTHNCFRGVQIQAARNRVVGVTAELSSNGGFVTTGADTEFEACHSIDGASRGYRIQGVRARINGGTIAGNTSFGVDITAAGVNTTIQRVFLDGNGAPITDIGSGTRVWDCIGLTPSAPTLTIASGVVTVNGTGHARLNSWLEYAIDTEAAAASDDLDTINGGAAGDMLILRAANDARTVVAKDGVGNLVLAGDFSMDNSEDRLVLRSNGTSWFELSRSDNGA